MKDNPGELENNLRTERKEEEEVWREVGPESARERPAASERERDSGERNKEAGRPGSARVKKSGIELADGRVQDGGGSRIERTSSGGEEEGERRGGGGRWKN